MRIAIHQPNFCAWLPFFQKMAAVDVFVLLRHVQFEKNGWQNRFQYKGEWMTMAVSHDSGSRCSIDQKRYADPRRDWEFIKRQIPEKAAVLSALDPFISSSLADTNSRIIEHIARKLHISTVITRDFLTDLKGTHRLVELCRTLGAKTYLAGRSGAHYMDLKLFEKAGIAVEFQNVKPEDEVSVLERL